MGNEVKKLSEENLEKVAGGQIGPKRSISAHEALKFMQDENERKEEEKNKPLEYGKR